MSAFTVSGGGLASTAAGASYSHGNEPSATGTSHARFRSILAPHAMREAIFRDGSPLPVVILSDGLCEHALLTVFD